MGPVGHSIEREGIKAQAQPSTDPDRPLSLPLVGLIRAVRGGERQEVRYEQWVPAIPGNGWSLVVEHETISFATLRL